MHWSPYTCSVIMHQHHHFVSQNTTWLVKLIVRNEIISTFGYVSIIDIFRIRNIIPGKHFFFSLGGGGERMVKWLMQFLPLSSSFQAPIRRSLLFLRTKPPLVRWHVFVNNNISCITVYRWCKKVAYCEQNHSLIKLDPDFQPAEGDTGSCICLCLLEITVYSTLWQAGFSVPDMLFVIEVTRLCNITFELSALYSYYSYFPRIVLRKWLKTTITNQTS